MELRHLRYFLAIAEELHFTRAAERLGIEQPPLSQQIKQLETELGAALFVRHARAVSLTEAGQAFAPHAKAAVAEAQRAAEAARQALRGEQGHIRIGFTSSASYNPLVPGMIQKFRDLYPNVAVSLVEQATSALLQDLHGNRLDAAFVRVSPGAQRGLSALELPAEEMLAALPARHRLASAPRIALAELAQDGFILFPPENGRLLYDSIIEACADAGFRPRIVQEAPQLGSTVNLVAAGAGVALVPASMRQLHPSGVVYARLRSPAPKARLWLCHPDDPAPSAMTRNLMTMVSQEVGPLRRR